MNTEIDTLKSEFHNTLLNIKEIENPLERLNAAIKETDDVIFRLKQIIELKKFGDDKEEIAFFKTIKPAISAVRIEEGVRYSLIINKPVSIHEIQLKYYEDELKVLQSFFRMNSFHYQYYKNGLTAMDNTYFVRRAGPLLIPYPEIAELDYGFSTPMSYLFAKFIAYEHLQYFILDQIAALKYPELRSVRNATQHPEELKWTGDVINIVELAYGLWLTGQLNNGNASLNHIVRWLETNLHVTIGVAQRRFAEITRRKRLSITKFTDQVKQAILKKIDDGNE